MLTGVRHGLVVIPEVKFSEDSAHMILHSPLGQAQLVANLFVGEAATDQRQDLHLPRREMTLARALGARLLGEARKFAHDPFDQPGRQSHLTAAELG